MDAITRQAEILKTIELKGNCTILDLAQQLGVSDETIRRDVKQLHAQGHVQKVHGGVRLPGALIESPFRQRMHHRVGAKQKLAEKAAQLISDGTTITIESGTTTFWMARYLTQQKQLTVITNGFEITRELCGRNNNRVFLAGGEASDSGMSTLGYSAIEFVQKFSPDICVISGSVINAEDGLCDFQLEEAEFARAAIKRAKKVIAVMDSSKFDRRAPLHVCDIDRIGILVTDAEPTGRLAESLNNVQVIVA
ncbi:DeoR/GlpR transcriptional regulator [Alteromonadaceae bacterium M269]|nr:DeoR/GlpR transcriptional regulator [Alteromonadaceae bacterium M269]